jgi:hypothetical protein
MSKGDRRLSSTFQGLAFLSLILLGILSIIASNGGGGGNGDGQQGDLVGPEGGTVIDPEGASVTIPAGALTEDTLISVTSHKSATSLPGPTLDGPNYGGGASFGPDGLVFQQPVIITIPIAITLTPGTTYPLYVFRPATGGWTQTEFVGVVNTDGTSIDAEVTHFSTFTYLFLEGVDAAKGLFGHFVETIDEANDLINEFHDVVDRFVISFPLNDKKAYKLDWEPIGVEETEFPEWWPKKPPPQPEIPPGYHCYETVGIDFILMHNRDGDYEAPLYYAIGEQDADVIFAYSAFRDLTEKVGEEEKHFAGAYDVIIWLRAVPPDLSLGVSDSVLDAGDSTTLNASLGCNTEAMEDQAINFSVDPSRLGEFNPATQNTSPTGEVNSVFTASVTAHGLGDLIASYTCCVGTEHPTVIEAKSPLLTLCDAPPAASVTVTPDELTLYSGQMHTLSALVEDSEGNPLDCYDIIWSSNKDDTVRVDPDTGQILALKEGVATITATVGEATGVANIEVLEGDELVVEARLGNCDWNTAQLDYLTQPITYCEIPTWDESVPLTVRVGTYSGDAFEGEPNVSINVNISIGNASPIDGVTDANGEFHSIVDGRSLVYPFITTDILAFVDTPNQKHVRAAAITRDICYSYEDKESHGISTGESDDCSGKIGAQCDGSIYVDYKSLNGYVETSVANIGEDVPWVIVNIERTGMWWDTIMVIPHDLGKLFPPVGMELATMYMTADVSLSADAEGAGVDDFSTESRSDGSLYLDYGYLKYGSDITWSSRFHLSGTIGEEPPPPPPVIILPEIIVLQSDLSVRDVLVGQLSQSSYSGADNERVSVSSRASANLQWSGIIRLEILDPTGTVKIPLTEYEVFSCSGTQYK